MGARLHVPAHVKGEGQRERERERERERGRISSRLLVVGAEPDVGLNPTNVEITT